MQCFFDFSAFMPETQPREHGHRQNGLFKTGTRRSLSSLPLISWRERRIFPRGALFNYKSIEKSDCPDSKLPLPSRKSVDYGPSRVRPALKFRQTKGG